MCVWMYESDTKGQSVVTAHNIHGTKLKWMSMFYVVCFIKLTCHNKGTQMCHLSFFHVQLKCASSEHIRIFHEFMPIIWKHMKADTYMCKLYCDKYVLWYKHFLGCNERFLFLFLLFFQWLASDWRKLEFWLFSTPQYPERAESSVS